MEALRARLFSRRGLLALAVAGTQVAFYLVAAAIGASADVRVLLVVGIGLVSLVLIPASPVKVAAPAPAAPVDVKAPMDRLLARIRPLVADDLYDKAVDIRRLILAIAPREGTSADPNLYLIRQTALAYLPGAFEDYLRLDRTSAEARPVSEGKTAHDLLLDQLGLMAAKLASVAEAIAHNDTDAVLVNGRFLSEKFGASSLRVDAPALAIEAAPPQSAPAEADARTPVH